MRQFFKAEVRLSKKHRDVTQGYRPTLSFRGDKLLCNFETVDPSPLKPTDLGHIVVRALWDSPGQSPIRLGAEFEVLEGDQCVGVGVIVQLMTE